MRSLRMVRIVRLVRVVRVMRICKVARHSEVLFLTFMVFLKAREMAVSRTYMQLQRRTGVAVGPGLGAALDRLRHGLPPP